MRANRVFVLEKYEEFNRECFAGTLPVVPLNISRSRRALGCLKFRRRGGRCYDYSIWISNRLDMPQEVIEDTIIHEMIHLYIYVNGLKDTSAHGKIFRTMMEAINTRHGRRITVSHRSTPQENASDAAVRDHYICLTRFRGGDRCITLSARTRVFEIHRQVSSLPEVESFEWLYSRDSAFNRFPRSLTLKFYKIPSELNESIAASRCCICDGKTLRFK